MAQTIFFLLLLLLSLILVSRPFVLVAQSTNPGSRISVVGVVYCDTCSTNSFSKHSYFLAGVDVHLQCTFKATSPRTSEQISFSVNRTTDKYGIYKLEVPHLDGIDCVDGMAIQSLCQASLIESRFPACNVPGLRTTTNEVSVKSKQDNVCIYSIDALSFKPAKRNNTLCSGDHRQVLPTSFNSSKFFLPYPPYFFPLPKFPFPPLPSFPFPPYPSLPIPASPPLFPFPNIPPFPRTPSLFNPPPPPAFNLGDPRTWIKHIPLLTPPPPAFSLRDPRTWIPFPPPFSSRSQKQNP